MGRGLDSARIIILFSSISDIGMSSDVDIGTLPISEWRFSVWHICLWYRNNRCRCRMLDIADIEIDVDAHLWKCCKHIHFQIYIFNFAPYSRSKLVDQGPVWFGIHSAWLATVPPPGLGKYKTRDWENWLSVTAGSSCGINPCWHRPPSSSHISNSVLQPETTPRVHTVCTKEY
jgi:hypothetical protein